MHPKSIRGLLALTALTAPAIAFAQDEDAADLTVSADAPPVDEAGAANVPENIIIVSARRRQEAAQDVPLAIATLDGRTINETGSFNVQKLQQLAPTLQVYSSNPRNTAVNIRGIGVPFGLTNDGFEQGVGIYVDDVYYARVASAVFDFLDVEQIEVLRGPQGTLYGKNTTAGAINIRGIGVPFGLTNDGIEQGVGIYVDDVYYSRVASATFDFLDVAQIEVLRGPQGTLYGKNTTAGAINITTHQPTFDFEGRAEVSLGNLGFKQAKASVSGPLSDQVAARLAFSITNRRGTIYNVTSDRWINEQDNLGIRGQLLWEPSANFDVTLAGDFSRQNPECCGTVFVGTGLTQRALARQYDALAAAQNYAVPSTDAFDRLTTSASTTPARRCSGRSAGTSPTR